MKWFLRLVSLMAVPLTASAAPAVRLGISSSFCFIQACPGVQPPVPTTVASGATFGAFIAALDSTGLRDNAYVGTVTFSSSDPLATLPNSYTFVAADGGVKAFPVVFRTLGGQSVTVSDSVNNLIPGTLIMTVTGAQAPDSIPTLSLDLLFALALILGAVGTLLLRLRS